MVSNHYMPLQQLAPFIHSYWTLNSMGKNLGVYRFAPDSHPELYFNLASNISITFAENKNRFSNDFGVLGQFYRNSDLALSDQSLTFFVKLQPLGLYALFNNNVTEFSNSAYAIDGLENLHLKIQSSYRESKDIKKLILIIENWLLSKICTIDKQELLSNLLLSIQQNTHAPVSTILSQYSLSKRRLQQIFQEKIGLSPKQYQRLTRFRKAMNLLSLPLNKERFIYALGYHDWSHFSKDMNYFFEISPTEFIHRVSQNGQFINIKTQ